ncbi:LysR family transcriptional regulator [Pelistega ratti]|uniref:LysR family transcriptional regulator n=1 Tax=Pelistega ratti TaxID=2652177 RepID=UPI00135C34DB|nr:LysR family transcriptional regulator [Pelistega ratti]
MDYFHALTIFQHIAHNGSFTATARLMGIAVSSVTRQIDTLENHLGVTLFTRSTRKLTLTAAGERYLTKIRPILADLADANQSLQNEQAEPQGKLRITFPIDYGNSKLSTLIIEFSQQYPKIELEALVTDTFIDLITEGFDIGIRLGRVADDRLIAKKLTTQKRLLVASPDYLSQYGIPKTPSDLTNHRCLPYIYHGYAPKWFFRQKGKSEFIPINSSLSTNSVHILLSSALNGQGITHLPDWLIMPYLQTGELHPLLIDWQITPTDTLEEDGIYLIYPPHLRHSAKVNILSTFLSERISNSRA